MDLHSSNLFDGNNIKTQNPQFPNINITNSSVITLQSSIRGYLARRSLGKKKVENFVAYIETNADKLMSRIIKIAENIEHKWFYSQITHQDHSFALLQLDYIKSSLAVQYQELKKMNRLPLATQRQENEYINELFNNEFNYEKELIKVFEKVGSMSLIKGLTTALGASDFNSLPKEIISKLKQYDTIFNPTACCVYDQVVEEKNSKITFKNTDGKETSVYSDVFEKNKIKFAPITHFKENSITDMVNGAELVIPFCDILNKKSLIIVKGFFKQNPISFQTIVKCLNKKYFRILRQLENKPHISKDFRTTYLNLYPIKDFILNKDEEILKEVEMDHELVNTMATATISLLYSQFTKLNVSQQARVLALLLMKDCNTYAITLYLTVAKDVPEFGRLVRNSLHHSFLRKLDIEIEDLQKQIQTLSKVDPNTLDYETRISISKMDLQTKAKAMEKVSIAKNTSNHESSKAQKFLDTLLSVPIGIYSPETVNKNSPPEVIQKHLKDLNASLDLAVFGQKSSKKAILEWRGQRIQNGESKGECIAFSGPPGTGKTTFALGIAKALNRPFCFIQLAGRKDGSYLLGHNYTYVGAKIGRILEVLIEAGCMDPVICIDEVDKVTGDEIMKILTAITDFTQNHSHEDLYFSGIKFDLSRVLFVLSLNDLSKLDPVFRDRLHVIEVDPLSAEEKIEVTARHLMPEILKSCGFQAGEVFIEDQDLKFVIENYTFEGGARKLKENLFSIVRQINLQRLLEPNSVQLPYKIDRKCILQYLEEPKIDFKKIASRPDIGTVNGLYATTAGIGGLTIIQALHTLSNERLGLELTGSQGKVMQESMRVARTVAWNVIPQEIKARIQKDPAEGLHVHCPEGATPKDGPSAGGAITTAIISRLTGIPVKNDVAMTGEIDLNGKITMIGGLDAKLHGAKKAGVKLALVPRDNEKDVIKIKTKYPDLIDDSFEVKLVDNIQDILANALVAWPLKL